MVNRMRVKARKVICMETGIQYENIPEALKALGMTMGAIRIYEACIGRRTTFNNQHWQFIGI